MSEYLNRHAQDMRHPTDIRTMEHCLYSKDWVSQTDLPLEAALATIQNKNGVAVPEIYTSFSDLMWTSVQWPNKTTLLYGLKPFSQGEMVSFQDAQATIVGNGKELHFAGMVPMYKGHGGERIVGTSYAPNKYNKYALQRADVSVTQHDFSSFEPSFFEGIQQTVQGFFRGEANGKQQKPNAHASQFIDRMSQEFHYYINSDTQAHYFLGEHTPSRFNKATEDPYESTGITTKEMSKAFLNAHSLVPGSFPVYSLAVKHSGAGNNLQGVLNHTLKNTGIEIHDREKDLTVSFQGIEYRIPSLL